MKKTLIFKIVSIVLVLCTVVTILVIPASASSIDTSNADLNSFLYHFGIEKVATRNIKSDGSSEVVSTSTNYRLIVDSQIRQGIVISPTVDTYFDLVSYQSFITNRRLDSGDNVTFSLSVLAPWCEAISLFVYFDDGSREQYSFKRESEKTFTKQNLVVNYSGESLAYDSRVFCHRYTLNTSFVSDGRDIIATQIQVQYAHSSKRNKTWLFYEDCNYYIDRNDSNKGILGLLGDVVNWLRESFDATKEFFLGFGGKVRDAVSPLITSVVNTVKNLGDTIGGFFSGIGKSIYNFIADSFLGDIFSIRDMINEYQSKVGQPQILLLSNGDCVSDINNPSDIMQNSSFFIDTEFYNDLYINVFEESD